MKIVFRVDSSTQMGIGHLMRCLTLANKLTKQNHQIVFICRKLDGNLIESVKHHHSVVVLPFVKNFQSSDLPWRW